MTDRITELSPIERQSGLPAYAQSLYQNVHDNAITLFGRNEEAATRMAESAVERFYEKTETGEWRHK